MGTFIISRKAKKQIKNVYEWNDDIYSIHLKNTEDVVWIHGKINFYNYLQSLS